MAQKFNRWTLLRCLAYPVSLIIAAALLTGCVPAAQQTPLPALTPVSSMETIIPSPVVTATPEATATDPPKPTPTADPKVQLAEYQHYFNQAIGVSSDKIALGEIKEVGNGVIEIYDTAGNLMIINQDGVNRLAPFGLSIEPEYYVWQQWQGSELGWKNIYELDDYPELHRQLAEFVQTHLIEPVSADKNETAYGADIGSPIAVNPDKANDIFTAYLERVMNFGPRVVNSRHGTESLPK